MMLTKPSPAAGDATPFQGEISAAATAAVGATDDLSAATHQRTVLSTDLGLTADADATDVVVRGKVLRGLTAGVQRRRASSQTGNDASSGDEDDDTPSYIVCEGAHPVKTVESLAPRTSSPIPTDRSETLPSQMRSKAAATGSTMSQQLNKGTSAIDVRRLLLKDRKRFLNDDDGVQSTRRTDEKGEKEEARLMADGGIKSSVGKANKRGGESHLVKTVSRLKQYFGMTGGCRRDADGDSERDGCIDEVNNERHRTVSKSAAGSGVTKTNRKRSENSEQPDHAVRSETHTVARYKMDGDADDDRTSVNEDTMENSPTLVDISDCEQEMEVPGCRYSARAIVNGPAAAAANCHRKSAVGERFIPRRLDDLRQKRGAVDRKEKTSAKTSNGYLRASRIEETDNGTEPSSVTTFAPGITVRVAPVGNRNFRVAASRRSSLKETDAENWDEHANKSVAAVQVTADRIRYRHPRHTARVCGKTGDGAKRIMASTDAIFHPPASAATGSSSSDAIAKAIVSRSTANVQRWLNYNERVLRQEQSRNDRACYSQQQQQLMTSPSQNSRDLDHRHCYGRPEHYGVGLHNVSMAAVGANPVFGDGGCRGDQRRVCGDGNLCRSNLSRIRSWRHGDAASATEADDDAPDDMGIDVRTTSRRHHRHQAGTSRRSSSVQSALTDRCPMTASTTPTHGGCSKLMTGKTPLAGRSLTTGGGDRSSQFESRLGPSLLQFVADVIESLENAAKHDDDMSSDYSLTDDDDNRHHRSQRCQQQQPMRSQVSTPSRSWTHQSVFPTSPVMRHLDERNAHRHSRSCTPQWQHKQRQQLQRRGTSAGGESSCHRKEERDANHQTPPFFEPKEVAAGENRQPEERQPASTGDENDICYGNRPV